MQWCFNEHKDVPRDIRDFLENASGQPLEQLSIEDINSFLTGIDVFAFWRVYLIAVGFSLAYKKPFNFALGILSGLWLFGLIFFSALGAFFANMFA